jgi:hypothetical protein
VHYFMPDFSPQDIQLWLQMQISVYKPCMNLMKNHADGGVSVTKYIFITNRGMRWIMALEISLRFVSVSGARDVSMR